VTEFAEAARLDPMVFGRRRVFCCHSATLSGHYPPNSLAAVDECVRARVPRLEVDLRFLSDDSMLIFHDGDLDAATTGSGRADMLDAEAARGLRYRGDESVGLCFLKEVVELIEGSSTVLQVDLKLMRPISIRRQRDLREALAPIAGQVILGSRAHWNLRGFGPGVRVALDPTLQWCFAADRSEATLPTRRGVHGLWDMHRLLTSPAQRRATTLARGPTI